MTRFLLFLGIVLVAAASPTGGAQEPTGGPVQRTTGAYLLDGVRDALVASSARDVAEDQRVDDEARGEGENAGREPR